MSRREEQTEAEMRRGHAIADRARRKSDLDRLNEAGKVAIKLIDMAPCASISGYTATFIVAGVEVCQELTADPEYPSDRVMATVNLAIASTVGYDGVRPPTPTHRVSRESKEYNKRLAEMNKNRWDGN